MTSHSAILLGPQRDAAVNEALVTASRHWREAFILDPAFVPVSVIHAGYYAMFHLARAILLSETGNCPYWHLSVAREMARLLEKISDPAERLVVIAFETTQALREACDYDPIVAPNEAEAHKVVNSLRAQIELAEVHFHLKCEI
jgi:uncharacterized protein (UPF0332 family)